MALPMARGVRNSDRWDTSAGGPVFLSKLREFGLMATELFFLVYLFLRVLTWGYASFVLKQSPADSAN